MACAARATEIGALGAYWVLVLPTSSMNTEPQPRWLCISSDYSYNMSSYYFMSRTILGIYCIFLGLWLANYM